MQNIARKIDSVIFVGLLVVLVVTVMLYGTVDAWWEGAFECAVFSLTAIWLLEVVLKGSWNLKRVYVLFPSAAITLYLFGQTISLAHHTLTIDRYQTHLTAVKMLALTLFSGLLLLHTSSSKRLKWLVRVVIGLGIGSAVFGIVRQLFQPPDATEGFVLPFLFPEVGYGEFLSPNVFAFLMEMVFGLMAALVCTGAVRRHLIFIYLTLGVVVWAALILSNSRGGMVGVTCQCILIGFVSLTWYASRHESQDTTTRHAWLRRTTSSRLVRVVAIAVILTGLVMGVIWMGGERLAEKHSSSTADSVEGITRQQIWHSTWNLIKHNSWTGVGFGTYFLAIPQYQSDAGRVRLEQAHNDYLDLAANGGVVAVILAALFAVVVARRARSSLRSSDPYRRAVALGAMASIVSVAVHSLVDFGLQVTGIAVVFAAVVVILIADEVESVRVSRSSSIDRRVSKLAV